MAEYRVDVTNTGNYYADDAVLGFIVPPDAGKDGVPLKYLFGFEKWRQKPSELILGKIDD